MLIKNSFFLGLVSASLFIGSSAVAERTYKIDTDKSVINWEGSKVVVSKHNGTIKLSTGEISLKDNKLSKGQFTIDMNSIKNLDVSDDKNRAKLEGHLKSNDFFSVDTYPTAKFVLKKAQAGKDKNWILTGDLTIKNKTHSIEFPAVVEVNDKVATAKANLSFDRSKWDVRYNSGKFFDAKKLGDNLINDEIRIELDLVANAVNKPAPKKKS